MSGGLYPVGGSKLYVGGRVTAKGTVTAADFAGQEWVEVGGWANAGSIGDTQGVGEQSLLNENRVRKFKTTLNGGTMENQHVPMALDLGQIKFKEAIASCNPYAFKIEWGGDCAPNGPVSISVAAPGVVTWNAHGLVAGQPVVFSNESGAVPAGLTAGVVYYVLAAGLTANTFTVGATAGAAEGIEVTAAGTGTTVATAPPIGMTDLFYGLALPGARSGGAADSAHLRTWSIAVDSNILEI